MKIVGLLENTTANSDLKCKHGLSLYIESKNHKILFDMGPNDLFLKNAEKLGIDISDVDTAVISHGHVDHCGGLKYFLNANKKAKIYIRPEAKEKHYVKVLGIPFYAGIDRNLANGDGFVLTSENYIIDDETILFSDVSDDFPLPKSDGNLYVKRNGGMFCDDFSHEQNLIIKDGGKKILVCGCAHAGIVNIINKSKELTCGYPDAVVGGFHFYEPTSKRYESDIYISDAARELSRTGAVFYTCHCTGEKACEKMKAHIGANLSYLRTGSVITI